MMNVEKIKEQAEIELKEEKFREAVAAYKNKIRNKRSFQDRIFPYKILIVKKEKLK